jgi:hypothetical protein
MGLRAGWTAFVAVFLTTCSTATPFLDAGGPDGSVAAPFDATTGVAPDATTLDTGHADSASESNSPDGEPSIDTDAGDVVADSGRDVTTDAGALDTGVADAGVADDGGSDTGVADAGPDAVADSGLPDGSSLIQTDVLTQHNDNARTGAYPYESKLTVANVGQATFGKLFARAVDDQIYAQPLWMAGIAVPGHGVHNMLYVATMSDTVYAFDADDPSQGVPLWKTSFLNLDAGIVPVTRSDVGLSCGVFNNISGNIGIESTPVIDARAGRIFVVAKTKNQNGVQTYTLHALDVGTGLDQVNPVVIQASVSGTGAGSIGNAIQFDPSVENQRGSLLLANGKVYFSFGGYCESGNYHGWILAYDAVTLAQDAVFIATPNGIGGGIWMSGQGPSADANGQVYAVASGGNMDVNTGGSDYSEALLELSPSLTVTDWFVPFDYTSLSGSGNFYGSAGVLLVPGSTLAVTGSETCKLYVNDTTALGHLSTGSDSQIVQSFQLGGSEIHGSPVALGNMVYVWAAGDTLRSYQVSGGQLTPMQVGPTALSTGQPGGELSLSGNGATPGTGILWVSQPLNGDASQATVPGILQAYDASNVATELWDSLLASGDDCGSFAKFASPTIANGKVYLPSFANQVCVYGQK